MRVSSWEISRYLDEKGIKHSLTGFRFLVSAIKKAIKDPWMILKISDLYGNIAQICGTETGNIERSIRYAIMPSGLTNKEFIAKAVDDLRYKYLIVNSGNSSLQQDTEFQEGGDLFGGKS